MPRELSVEEIQGLADAFGQGARRAKQAGFDAVTLHMAHGYLIAQFLSPLSNKRRDRYGGDTRRRVQFAVEVIQRVREEVGHGFPIICRISADEFVEGGLRIGETKLIAQILEAAGADAIDVSGGGPGALYMGVQPMAVPRACFVHLAEEIKKVVHIPVIVVGRVNDPLLAENILGKGQADLISMGRALLADPELPKKAAEGRLDDIRPCIACNKGCADRTTMGLDLACTVNAVVGREEDWRIEMAEVPRRVLVVGGGPAGMEAARVGALRGHQVTLCEKQDTLGGQLVPASVPPHKEEIGSLIKYFVSQITSLGVTVVAEETATWRTIRESKPDVVVLATGATPAVPKIPGIKTGAVTTAWEVLLGREKTGRRVAVIGGGRVGCETAEFLVERGRDTTILEAKEDIASDMGMESRELLIRRFQESGVEVLTHSTVTEVQERAVIFRRGGVEERLHGVDTVLLAVRSRAADELLDSLRQSGIEVHAVGDCVGPRNMFEAIHEGFSVAYRI